jgi:WD40 repeat protein
LQFLANGYFDFSKGIGCKEKARNILDKTNYIWIEEVAKAGISNFKIISSAAFSFISAVALSPDKKLFVYSSFEKVKLFQLPSLTMTFKMEMSYKCSLVKFLTFSPDSSYFLYNSIRSRVSIRKQKELKEVPFIPHGPENIFSCSFSSCGKRLVTSEENFIKLWDVRKKDLLAEIQTQFKYKYYCLFSLCSRYIIAGECTSKECAIWDSATLEKLKIPSNICAGTCLKYSDSFQIISPARSSRPRGRGFSIEADHFHLPTSEVALVTNKYLSEPFIWKDRKCVVVLNCTSFFAVYDIINNEIVDMFQIDSLPIDAGIHWITNLDKTNFLVWLTEHLVVLLSFTASEILPVSPYVNNAAIKCCTFCPDNEYIACCFENSILTVKSIDNEKVLQTVFLKHPPEACWWSELYLWVVCKGVVFKFPYDSTSAKVLGNAVEEVNIHFDRVLQFAEGVLVIRRDEKISMFKICKTKNSVFSKYPILVFLQSLFSQ